MTKHLKITHKNFLQAMIAGKKTINTRFTKVKSAPFEKVKTGDKVLLKESGKPISYKYTVAKVEYYINEDGLFEKLKKYSDEIQANLVKTFWEDRKDAKYITFIYIKDLKPISEQYNIIKKDRRGWVVLPE